MILVDTSAWVEYDRASGSPVDRRVMELVRTGEIAVTEPVLMEMLAGARDDTAAHRLRRMLGSFHWIPVDPAVDFEGAATLYRACRSRGITPRGLVDCLIVTVALRAECPLLAADRDFQQIASVVPLRLESV